MTSNEVRELRKNLGLTQQGLAQKLDCTVGTIVRWERNGNVNVSTIAEYALRWLALTLEKEIPR